MITGFVRCSVQKVFPKNTKITSNNIKRLFVHDFILDVKTFRFDACFFEVVKSTDEAFSVRSIGGKWKVLFVGNDFGVGTGGDGCFKFSGYTSGRVMMVLNDRFEGDGWLSCSIEFCDGGHGGKLKYLRVVVY